MAAFRDWTDRVLDNIGLKEWNYDPLKQTELPDHEDDNTTAGPAPSKTSDEHSRSHSHKRSLILQTCGATFVALILLFAIFRSAAGPSRPATVSVAQDRTKLSQSYLHVLVTANDTGPELCQTAFSAGALDWSTPRVLGWRNTPHFTGEDRAQAFFYLRNVLSWVNQLDDSNKDELIFILDSNDVWFQQRPATLINKYYSINERAKARIATRLGKGIVAATNISQSIVFAARRGCSKDDEKAIDCYPVPPSDVEGTIYGDSRDSADLPRHLDAASIIGPIGDVRKLFRHALDMVEKDSETPYKYKTAQDVFTRIYGEQSYQREVMRESQRTWWSKVSAFFGHDPRDHVLSAAGDWEHMKTDDVHEKKPSGETNEAAPYDFKIGLDYYGEISAPTLNQNKESSWIEYSSQDSIDKAAKSAGLDTPHKLEIPKELAQSAPPFWTPSYTGWLPLPFKSWAEVPLFTNMFTGVAPVAIHHKISQGTKHVTLATTWNQTWFHPHLRSMAIAKGSTVRRPIAVVNGPSGIEHWWNPHEEIGGLRFEDGHNPGGWETWEGICPGPEMAEHIFADGKGPWKQPVYVPDDKGQAHEVLHKWMQKTDGKLLHDII